MSSTPDQDPQTPAPEQPEATPSTESTPADPAATPSTDSAAPADQGSQIEVSIEMMLFEAGMIANSLSSKSLGSTLADKLFAAEQEAEGKQESRFTFGFSPFEAGMALGAMSRTEDGSLDDLKQRLNIALTSKMQELGVPPIAGQGGGAVGSLDDGSLGSDDQGSLGED